MRYIEALDTLEDKRIEPLGEGTYRLLPKTHVLDKSKDNRVVFLAGGITNCPDWQQVMVNLLKDTQLTLLNPRRANFPIGEPGAALEQITWEYDMLRLADAILFWFPEETICPIVLYELGAWSMMKKPIYVGVHPNYSRRQDVEIQTGLVRPDVEIVYSLPALAAQVIRG